MNTLLSQDEIEILRHHLVEAEGLVLFPYLDCCGKAWRKCECLPTKKGKLTIGVGRNIEDVGISENEAIGLQLNDITRATIGIQKHFDWFSKLTTARKIVITSMVFNLGINGFKGFTRMIRCIEAGDFVSASTQMLNSRWASQVGKRATLLSKLMANGHF